MKNAYHVLNKVFGYQDFRHQQADIIQALLNNEDAMVLMPTGGGKSLCYQIPAIIREGVGIVVSPLIALMQDQVDALTQLGLSAGYLNSNQTQESQREIEQQLINNEIDLLYITPERLLSNRMQSLLKQSSISLFAIDEAHCVSQWGHDFRKEYQQLNTLHQQFPGIPRIALTATADKRTRQEIIEQLDLHKAKTYLDSFDRPNIHYQISEQNSKAELLKFIQNSHQNEAGIIYCLSRKKVEEIANWLTEQGLQALPYHAGLHQQMREANQKRFLREDGIIIVATIAFGMGIDKPDVRFVAHLNLPKSIEAYYQETGRAGRDGLPADAWMAYGLKDLMMLKQMIQESDNEMQQRISHSKLDSLMALCETTSCRREHLLNYFDEATKSSCGNCDICISPPETWDATEACRKALSCIYRTEQRFGVGYLTDILLGKSNERILQNGHDKVTTYGIGKDISLNEWKSIYRQLIAMGYININFEQYGALTLTDKARPLLRGEVELKLRKQTKKAAKKSETKAKSALREIDEQLFEALRQCRYDLSKLESVPPYVIFHDKTLIEMSRKRPSTLEQMGHIAGIGEKKRDKFGKQFLDIIKQHKIHPWFKNDLSETINKTLELYLKEQNTGAVAEQRQLNLSTIYSHLSTAIKHDVIRLEDILEIEHGDITQIKHAMDLCAEGGQEGAKAVFEFLNGEIEYGIINCVRASVDTLI
ncbi:MAG: DNA helicase RecQ [Gammaproteobacteria bacterium]|nr:DNA helicase RecQ [Gammaproteobacteria bacterium]